MSRTIKFYYDFLSPYSYLASTQLPRLAKRVDASIDYKPIDVLKLMVKVGNQPTTVLCEAKLTYAFQDLARWSDVYQVPITPNPHLTTIDVTPLLLGAIAAKQYGEIQEYNQAVFTAYWSKQAQFKDASELLSILADSSLRNPEQILDRSRALSTELDRNIEDAIEDGVFGVPSFACDTGLFFGNDRLDFLEKALTS